MLLPGTVLVAKETGTSLDGRLFDAGTCRNDARRVILCREGNLGEGGFPVRRTDRHTQGQRLLLHTGVEIVVALTSCVPFPQFLLKEGIHLFLSHFATPFTVQRLAGEYLCRAQLILV